MKLWLLNNTVWNNVCWNYIKAGNPVHISVEFVGQGVTLTDEDISLDTGVTLTDIFNGDTDLVFGGTLCKQLRLRILNSNKLNGLSWTGEVLVQFHLTHGVDTYDLTLGYFYGEQPKNVTTARYIDFTAYDGMKKFDVSADEFINNLTYPITIAQMFSQLCSYVGATPQIGDALNTKNRSFASAPVDMTGYSCRDILGWIAEACGCYAKMVSKQCALVWFNDNTAHSITPTEEFKVESADLNPGLTWDEFDALSNAEQESMTLNDIAGYKEAYAVGRIVVRQIDSDFEVSYPNTYEENVYTINNNPFIVVSDYDDVTNYVKPIYDRLAAFGGYLPFSAECVGDPVAEAGDIITIDINGTTLTVPVFVKTLYWNGYFTDIYETTGQIPRSQYSSNADKEQVLNSNAIRMFVGNRYYQRQSGIEITDAGVTMSGSTYIDIQSGSRIDIESGADINVKSGGNLKVESGGNIDIHAQGTLDLTGSEVKIRSGSTFDVESTNFVINSSTKLMQCGNWKLTDTGVVYIDSSEQLETFEIQKGYPNSNNKSGIYHELYTNSMGRKIGFLYFVLSGDLGSGYKSARIVHSLYELAGETNPGLSTDAPSSFASSWVVGANSNLSLYAKDIHYTNIYQNSSRDIKHDIKPLESIGEKLDQLKPVTFVYDDDANEKTRMGLIYEDTQEVMPEICTDDESNKAISYIELVPALLKEIQELRRRVAELERRD